MRAVAFAVAAVVAPLAPASAQDSRYAYKAGVTIAEHSADQRRCVAAARQEQLARAPIAPEAGPGATTAGSDRAREAFRAAYEGCLAAAGYSQRVWPEADRKAMLALPRSEQAAAFAALVGGPKPRHPEVAR